MRAIVRLCHTCVNAPFQLRWESLPSEGFSVAPAPASHNCAPAVTPVMLLSSRASPGDFDRHDARFMRPGRFCGKGSAVEFRHSIFKFQILCSAATRRSRLAALFRVAHATGLGLNVAPGPLARHSSSALFSCWHKPLQLFRPGQHDGHRRRPCIRSGGL